MGESTASIYWFGFEGAGTALAILVAAILMLIRFTERRPSALTDEGEGERRSWTRPPTERDIDRTPSRVPGSDQHQRQTFESRRASADRQSKGYDGATQPRAPKSISDGTDCRGKRHDEGGGRVSKSIDRIAQHRGQRRPSVPNVPTDEGEGERRSRKRPPTERDIDRTPSRVPGSVQHRQTIESRRVCAGGKDWWSKSCDSTTWRRATKSSSDGTDCRSKSHDESGGRVTKSIDIEASVRDLQHTVSARRLRQMSEDELNCDQNGWDTIMKCREQPSDMSILKEAKIINHVVDHSKNLGIKTSTSSRLSSMGRREKMSSADAISLTWLGGRTRSPPKISLPWGPVFGAYDPPPAGRPRTSSWLAMKERHLVNQKLGLGEMSARELAEYPFISLSNSTSRKVPSENVQCRARFI